MSKAAAAFAIFATACAHGPSVSRHPPSPPALPAPPAPPASPALAALQRDLDAILNDPTLAHGTWGVMVKSLKTGQTVYTRNERKLMLPASNMKLVTLAAAAERLGWDYTFSTTLSLAGRIAGGTLDGDLVVTGYGDPSLGVDDGSAARTFGEWANRLKELGVRTVNGRIIGDDNAFEDETLGFGWSWDDLPDDYAAGIGALQFNENAVRVVVTPGPAPGDSAAITAEPSGIGVEIASLVTTAAADTPASLSTRRLPGSERLQIGGSIAAGGAPVTLAVAVDNPTLFFVRALRRALIAAGIDVRGPAIDIDDVRDEPPRATDTHRFAHKSPPLSALAMRLMKDSQNQYAETLMKAIAAPTPPTTPATAFGARAVYQEIFSRWGVHPGGLIVRDGSGLSRYDFVTADALVTILEHVYKDDRLRDPFVASLPVAGRDGSLANRMKATAAEGNARAKTGSMTAVRCLSGYVATAEGEPLAFSVLANNFETPPGVVNTATDAIVVRLASHRMR